MLDGSKCYLHSEHWCHHLLGLCWMCLYSTRRNDGDSGCYGLITQDLRARCAPWWSRTRKERGQNLKKKIGNFLRCLRSGWQRAQYPGAFKATFSSNGYLTSSAINRRRGDSGGCWNDLFNSLTRCLMWNMLCPRSKLKSAGQIVFCSFYKAGKPSLVCSSMFVLAKLQLQICMEVCTIQTAFISLYSSLGSNKSADFWGGDLFELFEAEERGPHS